MVTLFVLNVAEFQSLIQVARRQAGVEIIDGPPGYTRIRSAGVIELKRKDLGVKPAVWYGALTGGVVGRVVEYSRDTLRIEKEDS
ncbi:hypothetical protein [Ramlibacter sp. WS9]|uniref:hypothetical protein n=1 Tax=Ramlibacter sp. WS9 TaxID=1882741 RepID=UPI003516EC31